MLRRFIGDKVGRKADCTEQLSFDHVQSTIPLKEVWLNFGNFLPWFLVHLNISNPNNIAIWASNWTRGLLNPILDGVRAHPILDGGGGQKSPPQC